MPLDAALGPLLAAFAALAAPDAATPATPSPGAPVALAAGIGHSVPWSGTPATPALAAPARGAILMQAGFGSQGEDWINRVLPLRDGTLLAVGFLNRGETDDSHAFAVRMRPDGTVVWAREFGQAGANAFWAAREADEGRLFLCGYTSGSGAGGLDAFLLVLDAAGTTLAQSTFGGAKDDLAFDLTSTADGGVAVVGQTESSGAGERDVFLIRADRDGRELWRHDYGQAGIDRGFGVVESPDGGFVVAGITAADPKQPVDGLIMKTDANGALLWRKVVAGEKADIPHYLHLLPGGKILVVGYGASWGARDNDLLAITLAQDGTILHQEMYGGPGDDRGMTSAVDRDGHSLLVGYTQSAGAGDWDIILARLSPEGAFESMVTYGTAMVDRGTAVAQLSDGSLLLGAYYSGTKTAGLDGLVMRVDRPKWPKKPAGFAARTIPLG
ncbi:MAG TPA: hypothetical protein VJV75_09515 [Candidatus Polarisedimenticolia bacterium]|nr:hypothetical protein [Candidatus Polarisedimenticolia bacterium]